MAAWSTVDFAREGDPSFLADRLLNPDAVLTMGERTYLADLLKGKLPRRARHRPVSKLKIAEKLMFAELVLVHESQGLSRKQALGTVIKLDGGVLSTRTLEDYIRFRKEWAKDHPDMAARDAAMVAAGKKRRKERRAPQLSPR